jgi:hypothetical protein
VIQRFLLPGIISFLLLFSQQVAVVHPYSHSEDWQKSSQRDKQSPPENECPQCLALAGVASAIGSQGVAIHTPVANFALWLAEPPAIHASTSLPYRSRAPPITLA